MRTPKLCLILLTTLGLGCSGPATSQKAAPAPQKAAPRADPAATAKEAPSAVKPPLPEGSISKTHLLGYHKKGAQQFIAQVRVKATFRRGKFFGWRMLEYRGPGPIKPGDVVMDVIGMPIERPDQFMKVWEKLPTIQVLTVKLLRQDKIQTLSYPVVDDTRSMP